MTRASLVALSLAACVVPSPPVRPTAVPAEIRHYVRSNRDGSQPGDRPAWDALLRRHHADCP